MTIDQSSTSTQEAVDEIDVRSLIDQCDEENIIGLHTVGKGGRDDLEEGGEALPKLNREPGWSIPLHII